MPLSLRVETPADQDATRHVNCTAFARDDEARLVDALRDSGSVRLSLLAEQDGQVVGHILFTELPIVTGDGVFPALGLAPLAVLPEFQRQGIGSVLVSTGLDLCRDAGQRAVVVLGHPEFYRRFGFSSELARPLQSPFAGDVWMALELQPAALHGIAGKVQYPPPFGIA